MFLLIQNSPPATESARLGNSNAHRSTDADVFGSTSKLRSQMSGFVGRSLEVEDEEENKDCKGVICVSHLLKCLLK